MIFGKELIPKVLDGSKTVTRRPVKYVANQFLEAVVEKPCKYEVGKDYAVQPVIEDEPGKGRGGKEVGRLLVVRVDRILLGGGLDWTEAEAQREGLVDWPTYRDYWIGLYGSYDPTQLVDRIEFEALEDSR